MEPFTRLAQRVGKDDQLAATARLLFAALDCHLDKHTGHCAPTLARLAGWMGRDRRTIRRALRQLEAAGYVEVDRSAGRRNTYRLLPTGDKNVPSTGDKNVPSTGDKNVPSTGDKNVPGSGPAYRIGIKEQEGKNTAPPPRSFDLFEGPYRDWFTAALSYHLADVPDLAELRDWFPSLAAEFFLHNSWHRQTDPETAVQWARGLAAIAAAQAEAAEAFAWALSTPAIDAAGRKVFSRPDHLARILFRVQSQRRRNRDRFTAASAAAAEPACDPLWASATEAERLEVEAAVRRRRPEIVAGGLNWARACADELRLRAAALADAT
jgi:hypothetical protein